MIKSTVRTIVIRITFRGHPSGPVVKFARSALVACGLPVWIPGADMTPPDKLCCGRHPTYKVEEDGQMLAQGQSSSAKRGGLAADVSSGLIFLKKKRNTKTGHLAPASVRPMFGGCGHMVTSFLTLWVEAMCDPWLCLSHIFPDQKPVCAEACSLLASARYREKCPIVP